MITLFISTESKPSLKPKRAKEEPPKPSKESKVKLNKADASPVKKSEQSKKANKSDRSPSKKPSKSEASPKKVSDKKTKETVDPPKESGDHKKKVAKEPEPPKIAKAPTPEPPRKTPTPNYEDDFEVGSRYASNAPNIIHMRFVFKNLKPKIHKLRSIFFFTLSSEIFGRRYKNRARYVGFHKVNIARLPTFKTV